MGAVANAVKDRDFAAIPFMALGGVLAFWGTWRWEFLAKYDLNLAGRAIIVVVLFLAGFGLSFNGRARIDAARAHVPVDAAPSWHGALTEAAIGIQSATQPCFNTADAISEAWLSGDATDVRATAEEGVRLCKKGEYALDAMPLPKSIPADIAEPLGKAKLYCSLAMMRLAEVHRHLASQPFETMSTSEFRASSTSFSSIADAYLERLAECRMQMRRATSAVAARRTLDD